MKFRKTVFRVAVLCAILISLLSVGVFGADDIGYNYDNSWNSLVISSYDLFRQGRQIIWLLTTYLRDSLGSGIGNCLFSINGYVSTVAEYIKSVNGHLVSISSSASGIYDSVSSIQSSMTSVLTTIKNIYGNVSTIMGNTEWIYSILTYVKKIDATNTTLSTISGTLSTVSTNLSTVISQLNTSNAHLANVSGFMSPISSNLASVLSYVKGIDKTNNWLISILNSIGDIFTEVGFLYSDVENIYWLLVSFVVSVETSLFTISGTLSTISTTLTTVKNDLASVLTYVKKIDTTNSWLSSIYYVLTSVEGVVYDSFDLLENIVGDLSSCALYLSTLQDSFVSAIILSVGATNSILSDILSKLNDIYDNMGEVYIDIGDSVTNNEAGTNFWDVLEQLLSTIGDIAGAIAEVITAIAGIVESLIDGLFDLLTTLFVPSEDHFGELSNKFDSKFGFVDQIKGIVSDFSGVFSNAGTSRPNTVGGSSLTRTALSDSPYAGVDFVNWDTFDMIRPFLHQVISTVTFIIYFVNLMRRLPGIIWGFGTK